MLGSDRGIAGIGEECGSHSRCVAGELVGQVQDADSQLLCRAELGDSTKKEARKPSSQICRARVCSALQKVPRWPSESEIQQNPGKKKIKKKKENCLLCVMGSAFELQDASNATAVDAFDRILAPRLALLAIASDCNDHISDQAQACHSEERMRKSG